MRGCWTAHTEEREDKAVITDALRVQAPRALPMAVEISDVGGALVRPRSSDDDSVDKPVDALDVL
jgi:hypothetical protein